MITQTVAILLAMAATAGDPMEDSRKAFNNCLLTAHNDSVKAKMPLLEFRKLAETTCAAEKTAYHNIIVRSEREYGSSTSEATTYADEEVQMIIAGVKSFYVENLDIGGTMSLEK